MYTYIYVYIYIFICIYIDIYWYIHIYIYNWIYIYIRIYVYMYIHSYVYVYVYIYKWIHFHVYIFTDVLHVFISFFGKIHAFFTKGPSSFKRALCITYRHKNHVGSVGTCYLRTGTYASALILCTNANTLVTVLLCNTLHLQHIVAHCTTLHHTASYYNSLRPSAAQVPWF